MAAPNIPAAKRAGLPVDLERMALEGDGFLTADDRYSLKTYGVCPQGDDHMFMVRVRVPGGVLIAPHAYGLARLARRYGPDWLHLTTRQSIEFHWVQDRDVKQLLSDIESLGLSTRSACGHTLRNVVCSEDAGLGLDEPFDCYADARQISDTIVARSDVLNVTLPSRINISVGGSPRCREDALINDIGLVSVVVDGEAGYELWAGGSLGKSPRLSEKLSDFVPRTDVLAAVEAVADVFIAEGDFEHPAKGRMKFVLDKLGADGMTSMWEAAFAESKTRPHPPVADIEVLSEADRMAILSVVPPGGWSAGVRPQRTPGLALVTVDVPLGDTCGAEFELLAELAERYADGALMLTRDQDVTLRNVAVADVALIRARLAERGLRLRGEADTASARACTGATVCAVGITDSPTAARGLNDLQGLRRHPDLKVYVSGCPNSCAQHQAGDIGLAGSKVRIGGKTTNGYHMFVGEHLEAGLFGEAVGRVAEVDLDAATEAMIGLWEAVRHPGEKLGVTARRVGLDAVAAHLETVLAERWASGAEPELVPASSPAVTEVQLTSVG